MADEDVDEFPKNDTRATAEYLGYLSLYRPGANVNFLRFDSVGAGTADPIDYFRFNHTTGLTRVAITITADQVSSNVFNYLQELQILPISNFSSTQSKAIFQSGGIFADQLVNSDPRNQFDTFSKRFVFDVLPNSTFNIFAIRGSQQEDFNNNFATLDYTLRVQVWRETDYRNQIVGSNARDVLNGTNSDDVIIARGGNDIVRGFNRNDEIRGDAGNDRLEGGNGNDEINGGSGNDFILGGNNNDTINGSTGNDRAYGQNGNDFVRGGAGNDLVSGGNGNDRVFGDDGNDRVFGDAGNDLLRGGNGNDLIRGGANNDRIFGDRGADRIFGDDGNDIIYGGTENDLIRGGRGVDRIFGDNGNDRIFGDDQNDIISGGAGNDILYGGNNNDRLFGDAGADRLDGGPGNDFLNPGADTNADFIIGGTGIDTVNYSNAIDGVTVSLPDNTALRAAAGDRYNGVESIIGTRFNDVLEPLANGTAFGGDGNDLIRGAAAPFSSALGGTIRGDEGSDTLQMLNGATRAWVQLDKGADAIVNFTEGEDTIFIDLSEFGYSGPNLPSAAVTNSNTVNATGNIGQFIFEGDAQRLWFDVDGIGARSPVLIATFYTSTFDEVGTPLLGINDFEWTA